MSSPIGYPQGNAYPMFSATSVGDIPVAVGKDKTPVYTSTSSDGGIGVARLARRSNVSLQRIVGYGNSATADAITAHACFPSKEPFTHVQLMYSGMTAATGIIAKVAASAAKGNGYSPVDTTGAAVTPTAVTFGTTDINDSENPGGGATSGSIGAGIGLVTNRDSICSTLFSDIIACPSLPRTDGGSSYLLMVRSYSSGKLPMAYLDQMKPTTTDVNGTVQSVEPDWSCGYIVGADKVTDYTTYSPPSGSLNMFTPAAVRFFTEREVITFAYYGDSTQSGWALVAGNGGGGVQGYPRTAARILAAAGFPIVPYGHAKDGMKTVSFLGNAIREIPKLRPSIALLRAWSVNDGNTPTVAQFDAAMSLVVRAVAACRSVGTIPIVEVPPPQGQTGVYAANRIAFCQRVRAMGVPIFDLDALTTDGAAEPKVRAELMADPATDWVHFGRYGHDYLAAELVKVLRQFIATS